MSSADKLTLKVHQLIWQDKYKELDSLLKQNPDKPDRDHGQKEFHESRTRQLVNRPFRGQTPLGLAAELGRLKCVQVLLDNDADTTIPSALGFYPLQEGIACGNREICMLIIQKRFWQIKQMVDIRTPVLYEKLQPSHLPDLYVEIDWRFHSWIPLLSSFLPNDKCRIWKRGNKVRLDSTLAGLDSYRWQRGNLTFLFDIDPKLVTVWIIDHDRKITERIKVLDDYPEEEAEADCNVFMRMELITAKLKRTTEQGERIKFTNVKEGYFGLGTGDRIDYVDGFPCKVFDVKHLIYVSKTRKEHLVERRRMQDATVTSVDLDESLAVEDTSNQVQQPSAEKSNENEGNGNEGNENEDNENKGNENKGNENEGRQSTASTSSEGEADKNIVIGGFIKDVRKIRKKQVKSLPPPPAPTVSYEQYFNVDNSNNIKGENEYIHVGRPMILKEKKKSLSGRLWMTEEHPLKVEQLMPLIELIAPSNKHFEKLCDFVESDLPPGFPMKLDVPLFPVLSAEVTFTHYQPWDPVKVPLPQAFLGTESSSCENEMQSVDKWFEVPNEQDGYIEGIALKNVFKEK